MSIILNKGKTYNSALKKIGAAAEGSFPGLDSVQKIWREIITRKMAVFSTGMMFNLRGANGACGTGMHSLGYLGGVTWGYWTTVALLQYYLDPRWMGFGSTPNFGSQDYLDDGALHRRMDTRASGIAHSAVTGIMGALLPEGLSSFRIKFTKLRTRLAVAGLTDEITMTAVAKLERLATEHFQAKLTDPKRSLYSKLMALTSDYINYGTCCAILEKSHNGYDFKHIPFTQIGLATTASDTYQIGLWIEPRPIFTGGVLEGDSLGTGLGQSYINHMYVNGSLLGKAPAEYFELTSAASVYTTANSFQPAGLPRRMHGSSDNSPLMVARLNDMGQIYGVGCGLKALGNIIYLNLYSNCSKLSAIGSFYPAMALSQSVSVSSNHRVKSDSVSRDGQPTFSLMPGNILSINVNDGVAGAGIQPVQKLSNPPEQMAVFDQAVQTCLDDVQASYYVTLLSRAAQTGRDVTAEEVREQSSLAAQQIKGVLEPWYNNILYPLASAFAELACTELYDINPNTIEAIRGFDPTFAPEKDFFVEVMNFEKKQAQSERVNNLMAYAEIMAKLEMGLSQEEAKNLKDDFKEILAWGL